MPRTFLLLFWLLATLPGTAWAHPELVRHGYANCNACHVSPSGGGVLNSYGRSLSQALVSTWGTEAEAAPFYGAAPLPENVHAQAFIRGVQTIRDTPRALSGQSATMQTDLDIAATFGNLSTVVAVGATPKVSSPHHYLLMQLNEKNSLRVGKFRTDYGINLANHSASTRQGLGWGPDSESYDLEWGFQDEQFSGAMTAILGKLDDDTTSEHGIAVTGSAFLEERFKVGASVFHGNSKNGTRSLIGSFAILSFTPQFYFLNEMDLQFQNGNTDFYSYHRIGYDVLQGIQPYFMAETEIQKSAWGIGMMWNPRPHFEFQLEGKQRTYFANHEKETFGYLVVSLYL